MLEVSNLRRRPVAGQDDLLVTVEQGVEGMEELLLRTFLPAEELNIVNAKQIRLTITFPEFNQVIVLDRVDEFVNEQFARKINHFRVLLLGDHILPDRLHQVGFAKSDPAVNEKRVVSPRRSLGNGERGRVRDLIVRSDDK